MPRTKFAGLEITRIGVTPLVFQKKVQLLSRTAEEASIDIGNAARDHMRNIIAQNTKRPGSNGTLQKSIETHVEEGGRVVGVGRIADLPIYWAAQNFGSSHLVDRNLPMPGGPGTFRPGVPMPTSQDFRGGRWQPGMYGSVGGSLYWPKVTKPIPPMNYVEKTTNWIATIWRVWYSSKLNQVQVNTFNTGGITLG